MRHQVAGKKLGRKKDDRAALRRILIAQLFEHERIETTQAKALAIRGQTERLITLAKHGIKEGDDQDGPRPPAGRCPLEQSKSGG